MTATHLTLASCTVLSVPGHVYLLPLDGRVIALSADDIERLSFLVRDEPEPAGPRTGEGKFPSPVKGTCDRCRGALRGGTCPCCDWTLDLSDHTDAADSQG